LVTGNPQPTPPIGATASTAVGGLGVTTHGSGGPREHAELDHRGSGNMNVIWNWNWN
jgi:hypothetical protein